jgi:hypothetical protein
VPAKKIIKKVVKKKVTRTELKKLPPDAKPDRVTAARWKRYDKMDLSTLEKETVDDLRKYMVQHLKIAGVRAISGGKKGLINAIDAYREGRPGQQKGQL